MTTDSIGQSGGLNIYSYTGGDPVNFTDPWGLSETGVECPTDGSPYCPIDTPYYQTMWPGDMFAVRWFLHGSRDWRERFMGGNEGRDNQEDNARSCDSSRNVAAYLAPGAATVATRRNSTASRPPPHNLATRLATIAGRAATVIGAALTLSGSTPAPYDVYHHYSHRHYAASLAGGLWPGSYATNPGPIMTGRQARRKLALDHTPDALYLVIVNRRDTAVVGPSPVAPDYGQPGGGVEYVFPEGTQPGSVHGPFPIC